jgi:hypothetical protein
MNNNNAPHPQSEPQWWLASDGRWYPPELRSDLLPPPPPASAYLPMGTGWSHGPPSTAVHGVPPQDAGTRWSMRHSVVVVLCVLYMISPVDLLPELLLGPFGLVDDGFALAVAIVAAGLGLRADAADGPDER